VMTRQLSARLRGSAMTLVARQLNRLEGHFRVNESQTVLRIVVLPAGAVIADLEKAPCKRHSCADGTVMELVVCSGAVPSESRIDSSSISHESGMIETDTE
jgi:hypothetical protein